MGGVGCGMRDAEAGGTGWGVQEEVQAGGAGRGSEGRASCLPCRIAHGQQRRILSFRRGAILIPARSRIQTKGGGWGGGGEGERRN